jgi:16S rRNA (cytosine967-C5)-methyltransferase
VSRPRRRAPGAHGSADDARGVAHAILVRVETENAFADVLLASRLAAGTLGPSDRGLATELVFGTLVWQGRLDHHLRSLLHEPLERLDPPVRAALRVGLFQLLFLDRVPDYAAVDGSVRLAGRRAGGLVNAVLRRAARAGRSGLALPDSGDPIERLAVEWSHPRWLVERWVRELGVREAVALLEADTRPPRVALRPNPRRTSREALHATLAAAGVATDHGRANALVVVGGAGRLRDLPAYGEGLFSFQGEASQLVAALLDVPATARVLDACAAPGQKTLAIAERLAPGNPVVAFDRHRTGLRRLRAEAVRLGVDVLVAQADALRPPTTRRFDAVLVDAPCSGLGTLRRHPELKWRRRPDDIPRLATLQRGLVTKAAELVQPGGLLVYAVCTRPRDETTDVIAALLAAHPRFAVEPLAGPGVDADGMLRTAPHTHGLDGFFAARLRARS